MDETSSVRVEHTFHSWTECRRWISWCISIDIRDLRFRSVSSVSIAADVTGSCTDCAPPQTRNGFMLLLRASELRRFGTYVAARTLETGRDSSLDWFNRRHHHVLRLQTVIISLINYNLSYLVSLPRLQSRSWGHPDTCEQVRDAAFVPKMNPPIRLFHFSFRPIRLIRSYSGEKDLFHPKEFHSGDGSPDVGLQCDFQQLHASFVQRFDIRHIRLRTSRRIRILIRNLNIQQLR